MADNSTSVSDGANTFYMCTEVSAMCPVEATTLGYYPNKGLNSFIAAAFGLAMIMQLVIGVWKRTWSFSVFVVAGCALELAGGYHPSIFHSTRHEKEIGRVLVLVLVFVCEVGFT